jgi:hypothetical protein
MPVRWKRPTGHYVESHCGRWWITPIYGGCTRPERYELRLDNRIISSGTNQRECKEDAARLSMELATVASGASMGAEGSRQ